MRSLPVKDKFVRMIVDFGDASMVTQMGKVEEGALKFKRILEENQDQLASPELRYLYEDIQERRAFALAGIDRHAEALPLLKEALSFTTDRTDPQLVHFYLGVCYSSASEPNLAKEELLRAIGLGLSNQYEASARYRLAMLYFTSRAFAQSKLHLEAALALPEGIADVELRRFIYQGLSRTCHYLGEFQEEQKYLSLAKSS
jgi:tetratricopeptide (TPR) repeat protein